MRLLNQVWLWIDVQRDLIFLFETQIKETMNSCPDNLSSPCKKMVKDVLVSKLIKKSQVGGNNVRN